MENDLNNVKQGCDNAQSFNKSDDNIDLRELLTVIWKGKWFIIVITALFVAASIAYAISQPNVYKSEALLAPAEQEQGGSLGALAGQFGGLASLAGVNLGAGGGVDKTQMALEVLKSRRFTSEFIKKYKILPDLMAAESWDPSTNTIIYDQALYNNAENKWVRDAKPPFTPEPSMQEAYKIFSKTVTANKNKETGMVTISIEHVSPIVAQQWVTWLIQNINTEMKERDVQEANRSTLFLMNQLEQTKISDIRAVLYKLVEEQTKTIMFANVRDEYAFKIIDPAFQPQERFKPIRGLIIILGVILGAALGVMAVLTKRFSIDNQK